MTRTNPWLLVLWFLAAGVVTWAVQSWVTSGNRATVLPSIAFGVTLALIGAVALALAWPVRRYTAAIRRAQADHAGDDDPAWREVARRRVDPARATLALALAKASSLGGSIFSGGCAATVLWIVSRTVIGAGLPLAVFSLVCAVVLLVAGLVAESWCALPPDTGAGVGSSEAVGAQ